MENLKCFNSEAKISDLSMLNSKFTRGRCRILYAGRNRNRTNITENAINKLIARKDYANVPVVAHLYKGDDGSWRVGGHDSKFVTTDTGFEIADETIPFGVIPEDCNPSFEKITEHSGEVKRYFCVDIILWTHRYNIMDAAKSDELWFNQSMEIEINSSNYDRDGYCVINDFNLSALCLLNHDPNNDENEVEPCFPSAGVTKFNIDKLKQEFKNMYAELKNFMKEGMTLDINKVKNDLDSKYFAVQATDNIVIAVEKETFKVFSIPCTESNENSEIVFDYDKAVEKFMSVSDKDTGFSVVAIKEYVSEYSNKALEDVKAKFAEDAKFADHRAEVDKLIATYDKQLGLNIEFIEYKKNIDYTKTLDQINNRNEKAIGKKIDEIESLEDDILDLETSWQNIVDNLIPSDSRSERVMEVAKDLLKQWNEIYGNAPKNFSELYNSAKFSAIHDALQQLARDGELTAEKFAELNDTDINGVEDFKKALEDIGETDADQIVESIIVEVNNLDDAADKGKNSINAYTKSLEKLYETLDKIIGKQEKLADAFKKIRLGSSLSADEVYELVKEMPNILKYLEKTDDGYTISADNFNAISNENIDAEKDKLQKSISETKTQIALLGALQKAALDVENSYGKDQGLVDHFIQLSDATEELRENLGIESMGQISKGLETLQESLKQDELHLDVLTSAFDKSSADFYDDAKSKISEFNNELKTFDSAIKTLNEGNTLNYDEMVEIVELAPELQDFFMEMQDGYTISVDKIEKWRKKSFEARNEYIQGLIEQAKTELEAAQNAKQAAEIVLNIQNQFGSAAEQLMAQVDLEAAEKKIKDILDVIEKYEALMGDLKYADDSGQKLTDELQKKIDYYKTILDAVSAVKDRYTEILDNEIDALEESKDALKDTNDERQRELDLIEARNNLENAKKRKVYVYTEGEGFKQVQDKAAVKEAEEKYRDAITEVQVAEIDKAIEEREKQKEALEQSVKDLLELEQNIQDSMAISQAMQALGLSDPSQLLSLPESVKEGIINGLADATIQKDIEDNKENVEHIAVTLDDVLANLGSNKTMANLSSDILDNVKQAAYNNIIEGLVQAAKDMAENMINNTTNINNPTINQTNSIVINDATDPEKVGQAVGDYIKDMLTRYDNSLK